jgi:hypothetical protein
VEDIVLRDYRNWLESELKLLGNASHHAYSFGQANMAKRAIERLDQELHGKVVVALEPSRVDEVLTALELLAERDTSLDPALEALREELQNVR